MSIPKEKIFHLGLCMAGSVTAGAYTAGVLDYFIEALERWEEQRGKDDSLPDHHVVIDLLSGTSGGGMNAAMANFALRDKLEHGDLKIVNGKNEFKPTLNNIFWKSWVELRDTETKPLFGGLLDTADIDNHNYVASGLNSKFIDEIAGDFSKYITNLANGWDREPAYLCPENEVCMMVFNVTGIRYKLMTKAAASGEQYAMQHRDLGHFRWQKTYIAPEEELTDKDDRRGKADGRIEIHFSNMANQDILIDAAKATGAFPVGLKPRLLKRPAKYIWDNPFFKKGDRFNQSSIFLGDKVLAPTDIYTSINADGGTANNEPVELCRELLYEMRLRYYKDLEEPKAGEGIITRREEVLQTLTNSSVILIDPFPSISAKVKAPVTGAGSKNSDNITLYAGKLLNAMRSTLLTDAKLTMDAYKKENYGLHLVAPSHSTLPPEHAIACGSLDGFGGFLSKEFRIHDFFLGRHNAQSFLRQYFVVDLNEDKNGKNYECIKAVIDGYENNAAARKRFEFKDKQGKSWAPIIPDVTLSTPFDVNNPQNPLPEYKLKPLAEDALDHYRRDIKNRVKTVIDNIIDGQGFIKTMAKWFGSGNLADKVLETIKDDLKERHLMKE